MSQPLDLGPSSKSTDKMWMVEEGAMFGTPLHNFGKPLPSSLPSHPHLQVMFCFRWQVSGFLTGDCRSVSADDSNHRSDSPLPEFPALCNQRNAPIGSMGPQRHSHVQSTPNGVSLPLASLCLSNGADEQFENGEEELERFLSSSKERLRDAGTPQVQRLFDDASDASPRKISASVSAANS